MKKKVLIFFDWYLPGYKAGGPIRSIAGLISRLKSEYEFKVITLNTDLHETTPYPNIVTNAWNKLDDGTDVFYCSHEFISFRSFKKLILEENPDFIYLNSMFSLKFTLMPLLIGKMYLPAAKIIIATRGMVSRGALAIRPLKKNIFLSITKAIGLYNHVTFHASTDIEAKEIINIFGRRTKVIKAMNLVPKYELPNKKRIKIPGEVKLFYLGRICELKNLHQSLVMLSQTDPKYTFIYDVFGPIDEEDHFEQCQEVMKTMPPHVRVHFKGETPKDKLFPMLGNYHFLLFLTKNDNFGHSIVESFAAGCPVIISDQTPWKPLRESKSGWDIKLNDSAGIVDALNQSAVMDQNEYDTWSEAAYNYSKTILDNLEAVRDNIRLFGSK